MSQSRLNQIIKKIAFRAGFLNEFSRPKYEYCLSPAQLSWLCNAISDTKLSNSKQGCVIEIGVARGMTSTFLLKHMEVEGDRRSYYCIDTFGGFTTEDIDYEVKARNKKKKDYSGFSYNDFRVFQKNLIKNGFKNATAIGTDVSKLDFSALAPIDVILVDVDLYRPTLNSLCNSYKYLNDNAFVMVDDVVADSIYDGAIEAYHEFIKTENLPCVLLGNRSGLILKREPKREFLSQGIGRGLRH